MTDTDLEMVAPRPIEELNEEVASLMATVGPMLGPDANTIQVKARLDGLVELLTRSFEDDAEKASFLEALDDAYVRILHPQLTDIASQIRRAQLQAGISEQAGKLTVVR